jgi:hypothetical protein
MIIGHTFGVLYVYFQASLYLPKGSMLAPFVQMDVDISDTKQAQVFLLAFLRDKLNIMFLESYNCVLCVENQEEYIHHVFFGCPFSQGQWIYLVIN